MYANENDGSLPDAGSVNSPVDGPMAPRTLGSAPWTPVPWFQPGTYVLPSVGDLLLRYVAADGETWRCPSAAGVVRDRRAFALRRPGRREPVPAQLQLQLAAGSISSWRWRAGLPDEFKLASGRRAAWRV